MKTYSIISRAVLVAAGLAITVGVSVAQTAGAEAKPARPAPGERGPGGPGGPDRPRLMPFMLLDANRDGELSAAEIDAAPQVLRKLDVNGDGKLTRDELMPRRRQWRDAAPTPDGDSRK